MHKRPSSLFVQLPNIRNMPIASHTHNTVHRRIIHNNQGVMKLCLVPVLGYQEVIAPLLKECP